MRDWRDGIFHDAAFHTDDIQEHDDQISDCKSLCKDHHAAPTPDSTAVPTSPSAESTQLMSPGQPITPDFFGEEHMLATQPGTPDYAPYGATDHMPRHPSNESTPPAQATVASEAHALVRVEAEAGPEQAALRAAAEEAVRANKRMQAVVRCALLGIKEASAESQAQAEQLQMHLATNAGRRLPRAPTRALQQPVSFFSEPNDPTSRAPKNQDAVNRARYLEAYPAIGTRRVWEKQEEELLRSQLLTQLREQAFKSLYRELVEAAGTAAARQQACRRACQETNDKSAEDLYEMVGMRTDWFKLSRKLAEKSFRRSARSCYIHWTLVMHPGNNRRGFTKQEDMTLLRLANGTEGMAWESVAAGLDSSRSAWQCFSRFQRSLNPKVLLRGWSEEETERALLLAEQAGVEKTFYSLAARLGEGRTADQVQTKLLKARQARSHLPRRSCWTAVQSRRLRLATQIYGLGRWLHIARHVPGRSQSDCLQRTQGTDNPDLKRLSRKGWKGRKRPPCFAPWAPEEDAKLMQAIRKYGAGNWCLIRRDVPGRTTGECFRRFQALNPENMADMYDILLATKRKMLPSRFPHRSHMWAPSKRRRSELVASDFNLHLYVPEESSATCPSLTTGDPQCDVYLRRVNERRRRQCCEAASTSRVVQIEEPSDEVSCEANCVAHEDAQQVLGGKSEPLAKGAPLAKHPRGLRGSGSSGRSIGRGSGSPHRGRGRGVGKVRSSGRTASPGPGGPPVAGACRHP